MSRRRPLALLLLAALGLPHLAIPARAERLPLTLYSTGDMAGDRVRCALEDERGFLWFGTHGGLFRFDGKSFRRFGVEAGLKEPLVLGLVRDDDGALIVSTPSDAYRFDPADGGRFRSLTNGSPPWSHGHSCLLKDRGGSIWVGTPDGLFRLRGVRTAPDWERVSFAAESSNPVFALLEDRKGNLWVAGNSLYRMAPDGGVIRVRSPEEIRGTPSLQAAGRSFVTTIVEDEAGRIWAGGRSILLVTPVSGALEAREFAEGGPFLEAFGLIARPGGGVWAGSRNGLREVDPFRGLVRTITTRQGLREDGVAPQLVDGRGNLWISTRWGLMRLASAGLTSFGRTDGLAGTGIASVFKTRAGDLVAVGNQSVVQRHEGEGFVAIQPSMPGILDYGWGLGQWVLEDSAGDWWIPTGDGLVRFARPRRLEDLARARPLAVYTTKDGLPSNAVFRLFEDSHRDIWIGLLQSLGASGNPRATLVRWERATRRFHEYGPSLGVPNDASPTAFYERPDGVLWVGFHRYPAPSRSEVFRFAEERFVKVLGTEQVGDRGVHAFHTDRRGRMWMATGSVGACRVDQPTAERPSLSCLTTRQGLASDSVLAIVEDAAGRIYIGTSHGVDILDEPATRIVHLDTRDGLPNPYVTVAISDPKLGLWFGTLDGLAHLDPSGRFPEPAAPPRVLIDSVRVAGTPIPVSAFGEAAISDLALEPDERHLQIDLLGLTSGPAELVRFQYRLGRSESWTEPSDERSITLARLAPGTYRFEGRALDASGRPSPEPAVVSFRVLPPFYRRTWFLAIACAVTAGMVVAVYRARVAYLLALERQRTRIAMDLHDEIGSGLGSIGLLADLGKEEGSDEPARGELDRIAAIASELGASMADIVWSLRPGSETIESLARRLAERGRRLFPGQGARLETRFPEIWPSVDLSLAARHNVLRIGQEALHNAARHSGARLVILELAPDGARWMLRVSDDGRGMRGGASDGTREGHATGFGLETMRRRAAQMGATLELHSLHDEGTTVTLVFDPRSEGSARRSRRK